MNSIALWALTIVAGFVGRYLAGMFAGSCPAAPQTWLCVHWADVASIGSAAMAALGYGTAKQVAAKVSARAALRVAEPPPLPAPDVEQRQAEGNAQVAASSHEGP